MKRERVCDAIEYVACKKWRCIFAATKGPFIFQGMGRVGAGGTSGERDKKMALKARGAAANKLRKRVGGQAKF